MEHKPRMLDARNASLRIMAASPSYLSDLQEDEVLWLNKSLWRSLPYQKLGQNALDHGTVPDEEHTEPVQFGAHDHIVSSKPSLPPSPR
jgi:hypothetical protein